MAQWIKTEVRCMIVDAVAPVVGVAGFRFKKASGAFVRKIDDGRQELGLALVDYNPVFRFSFSLCTRFAAVQAITNRFSGSSAKYHSMTLTSITQLEFLGLPAKPGVGVDFEVSSESELMAVMPGVLDMVRDRVLPFFEQYRDIAAVNRGLNPEGADQVFHLDGYPHRREFDATNHPYRAMTGVAAAAVAKDPRTDALISAYRSQLGEMPDRSKFENLVSYLRLLKKLRELASSGAGIVELVKAIEAELRPQQVRLVAVLSTLRATFGIELRDLRQLEEWKHFGGVRYSDEEINTLFKLLIDAHKSMWKSCVGPVNAASGAVEEDDDETA